MTTQFATTAPRRVDDLLHHLPAGVVVHDANGRILSANRLACELLGQSAERLHGIEASAAAWGFVCPDGSRLPVAQFPVNVVLETRRKVADVLVGVPAGGPSAVRWLICNAYPELDTAGNLLQVVVCFTDCTALKEAQQRLQDSEERLRLVLRGSTDAPWDWNLISRKIYYSDCWWNMLGYHPGELHASPGLWVELMHDDDRPAVETFLRELIDGPLESYSIEFRLRHRDGHDVPVLSRGFVLRDSQGRALRISGTNTDLTERKIAERRIHELAYYDFLTGLPNRRLLAGELATALARSKRSGRPGAVVFMDLDNFKLLNDTMGHDVGDRLLCEVATRLRSTLRHSDQLARLGGDEFVVVLEELGASLEQAEAEAGRVAEKLRLALAQPYELAGRLFPSTPSMGVVLFDGCTAGVDTLLKHADLAMYQAKREGRNRTCFFELGMQAAAVHRAELERAMRDGLAQRQFVLFCQPQFSSAGSLTGAEVLLRWRRADGVLVAPDAFIGLAEASGFIVPLGQYVLEESCRALARWQADEGLAALKLAVNVSVQQMRSVDFTERVVQALAATGAPAGRLCLELTESVFADKVDDIISRMDALRRVGLHFSLDDFGTGYSSLAYLRRFPISTLKIDRSFVQDVHVDPDAAPIVEAIIAMARKLKLETIAEGVEHEAQRHFLVDAGCSGLQGYLLGRPMPIEDFERRYARRAVEGN